ncbi:hypothetical protein, partial [Caulobacter sp.]|uniref:hypothetical protein n=1 Tax=Caulobacter sp. TaxID=78 RepID=UPI002B468F4B
TAPHTCPRPTAGEAVQLATERAVGAVERVASRSASRGPAGLGEGDSSGWGGSSAEVGPGAMLATP